MRLIDADKLENEIVFNKLPHSVWELDAILTSIVSSQDTVEAIPIEWMYEWRMKNNEQYNVGLSSFSQMISDWEKENES